MTKAHPLEKDVKAAVNKLLDKHGWYHFAPGTSQFGLNGVSDKLALKNGTFLALEIKLYKEVGSDLQQRFGKAVMDAGGLYRVVNLNDVESGEFEVWLTSIL